MIPIIVYSSKGFSVISSTPPATGNVLVPTNSSQLLSDANIIKIFNSNLSNLKLFKKDKITTYVHYAYQRAGAWNRNCIINHSNDFSNDFARIYIGTSCIVNSG